MRGACLPLMVKVNHVGIGRGKVTMHLLFIVAMLARRRRHAAPLSGR